MRLPKILVLVDASCEGGAAGRAAVCGGGLGDGAGRRLCADTAAVQPVAAKAHDVSASILRLKNPCGARLKTKKMGGKGAVRLPKILVLTNACFLCHGHGKTTRDGRWV